ncbi:MAG: flagellar type III secretion system pore protein FliP [Vampirovibrionales bacterium]
MPTATPALQGLDPAIQLMLLMGSFTLLPFVASSMTCFMRYIIVLSILKQAMGTQQVPPAVVLVGLAIIMTFYTMAPTFGEIYAATAPMLQNGKGDVIQILEKTADPLKYFMMRQTREEDIKIFLEMTRSQPPDDVRSLSIWEVAPAFMLSELRTSFEIGFIIFIPFVVVDMVVSNILTALGMSMLSPTIISLPFKILIFVAVDGWGMVIKGLMQSFN